MAPSSTPALLADDLRRCLVVDGPERVEGLHRLGLRPLAGGRNNHVFAWRDPQGDEVCVKAYRFDDRQRAEREWRALSLLARHGVPNVPRPLWREQHEDRPVVAMTMLPGVSVPDLAEPAAREAALVGLAVTLCPIHDVPWETGFARLPRVDSAAHYVARLTEVWPGQLGARPDDPLTRDLRRLLGVWRDSGDAEMLARPVARIFSRGDGNLVNWLWDSEVSRCVDFEFCGWSDLAFDAADLVEHISAREFDDRVWSAVVTALGIEGELMPRFRAAQRTCALRWLAVLWKQRERRAGEFSAQLDRVRVLLRDQ
ncbi:aminoglycoside phosphotransferase family protein [Parafrankia elaeagni]|uniref:aminoglycoside phosphotransferase family protein n=1 Tax=Parafrankia elaeagni TaxID=222534 RepID=UPI0006878E58|nr:aminoglycoside phosphotransferase family protein [Parafrankia elaeagni]